MIVGILCDWAGVVQGNPMIVGIYLRKSFGRSIIPATIGIDRTGAPTKAPTRESQYSAAGVHRLRTAGDQMRYARLAGRARAIAVGPGPRTAEGVKAARAEAVSTPAVV